MVFRSLFCARCCVTSTIDEGCELPFVLDADGLTNVSFLFLEDPTTELFRRSFFLSIAEISHDLLLCLFISARVWFVSSYAATDIIEVMSVDGLDEDAL